MITSLVKKIKIKNNKMGLFNKKKKEVISEINHPIITKEDSETYANNMIKAERTMKDLEVIKQIKLIKKKMSELNISDSILIDKILPQEPEEPKIEIMSFDEYYEFVRIQKLIENNVIIYDINNLNILEKFLFEYEQYVLYVNNILTINKNQK